MNHHPVQHLDPVKYSLNPDGRFVIENYNHAPAFSNFFPGIAGLWGIPMWVFYVNRGQCISSFGIESKDKSILEFQPANKAYRLTSLQGFRTFLKIKSGLKIHHHEPFQNLRLHPDFKIKQNITITSHDLTLEEINSTLGLIVRVNYFTLPEEPYAALIRRLTLENISQKNYEVELIDGLPVVIPYGMTDWLNKNMSRTVEAWVMVRNLKKNAPFYHLKVVVSDKPAVTHIEEGNFYFSFDAASGPGSGGTKLFDPIVSPEIVFGNSNDLLVPEKFLNEKKFSVPTKQLTSNRTPCAMSFSRFHLKPKKKKEIISVIGYTHQESQVNHLVPQMTVKGFIDQKAKRNKALIQDIKNFAFTNSSSVELNQYCEQTFLDNVLRGGLPVSLKTEEGTIVLNVFSRKHGDPERDYNFFVLSPTYFSQGNGNYRDVNQNRRNDVWFNPLVKDQHIISFINLLQADGYNPLIVKGLTFVAEDAPKIDPIIQNFVKDENRDEVRKFVLSGFQPGELLKKITHKEIEVTLPPKEFLKKILGVCHKNELADHGEGYWTDHWSYNLDLIESFLSVYPEELKVILLEKRVFSFYFDLFYIVPRENRYILTANGVRQYHSVAEATKEIKSQVNGHKLRIKNGEGPVYHTSLIVKLLCLAANKVASLDPSGIGIEMEADKPNWYDALNGLPGLLGSSICETFELKRLCQFLLKSIQQLALDEHQRIKIFEELATFMTGLSNFLAMDLEESSSHGNSEFFFWMKSNDLKEHYRQRIRLGVSGQEPEIAWAEIKRFLNLVMEKTNKAIVLARGNKKKGLYPTYFFHEVTRYELLGKLPSTGELTYVRPLSFKLHELPLFLEGFVHGLRVEDIKEKAKDLYRRVKSSALFDQKLKMYKVNEDLSRACEEIGRTRIFPSGWLENESVWLHMEYKFLLEVLRCGLYEEFYEDFRRVCVPFLQPGQYGRSVLENSSFIVSSAHEDSSLHGRGFVARLSGSTAEFLHIWLLMNVGLQPFTVNSQSELTLTFKPALPGWLFTTKETEIELTDAQGKPHKHTLPSNTYAFNFLGSTLVVYHNSKRKNTFGANRAAIKKFQLYYPQKKEAVEISSSMLPTIFAKDVRDQKMFRIDVFLE